MVLAELYSSAVLELWHLYLSAGNTFGYSRAVATPNRLIECLPLACPTRVARKQVKGSSAGGASMKRVICRMGRFYKRSLL